MSGKKSRAARKAAREPAPSANQRFRGQRQIMLVLVAALTLGAAVLIWRANEPGGSPVVPVEVPELSPVAQSGLAAFEANCASCHGIHAAGTEQGPPLVHRYYEPGHHADVAFVLASQRGVQQHHWNFGDMPAQPQVTRPQIEAIIRYVRELQRANGIGS